jgi:energy-coupling factor transporter ATP-binding protein EcfA2
VDAIAPGRPLDQAIEILTACGLGEPRLWVRQFADLADGEKFRAGLAQTIGEAMGAARPVPILCDEFTAILHRRAAQAVAYNLRKLVTRHGLTLVAATTHLDIIEDLQPDQTVTLRESEPRVTTEAPKDRPMSLRRRLCVRRGSVADYRVFSPMHYRHRDRLGFVDRVFLLAERGSGAPLGILVFAHAPLELHLRNQATEGRFIRNGRRLNRELRILRRLVMHPDVRGCGLGHWFVRRTLPRVGVRFIECLAAMGAVNPIFERAGMHRVGRCPPPRGRLALLERMKTWGLDPFAEEFPRQIARFARVRRLVEETVAQWIRTTRGAGRGPRAALSVGELSRIFRQLLGQPPMYYLWDRERRFPRPTNEEGPSVSTPAGALARQAGQTSRTRESVDRHRPEANGRTRPWRHDRSSREE